MNTRHDPRMRSQPSRASTINTHSNEAVAKLLTSLGTLLVAAVLAAKLASTLMAPTLF